MVDAGIQTPDEVIKAFKGMQLGNNFHYIIYRIQEMKYVSVDSVLDVDKAEWDWDAFCDAITESGEPRFATIDFHYKSKDNFDTTKLLFVSWVPEIAKPGDKMLYASTKEGFKSKLDGVQKVLQATDESELDYDFVKAKVESL